MTALEKYNDLLSNPQLQVDGLTLQVSAPWWKSVEIRASVGQMADEQTATGFAEFRIFLKPEEVDNLIERLKVAKDALVEKLAANPAA